MKSTNIFNKMKDAVKLFVVLLFITGVTSSCIENLLNTSPYDKIGSGTMWSTEAYTEMGLAGIYNILYDGHVNGTATNRQLYEMDQFGLSTMKRANHAFKNGTILANNGLFSDVWKAQYTGITRANDLINNMPDISPVADDIKARYVAEAKFLRAYFYFRLNQLWKGVPVYLEQVPIEEMNRPRETEEKVWEIILTDLNEVISEPNLPEKYAKGDNNYGHITKGAAYALRGKVYLYMKEYTKAISDFEQVEKCGYALFQGGYYELFKEENEQCEEMIFSIQYTDTDGYGSVSQLHLGSRSAVGNNWNTYLVSNDVVDLYETKEGKAFNWDDYLPGYNDMDPADREVFFLRDTLDLEAQYPGITQEQIARIGKEVKDRLFREVNEKLVISEKARALYLPKGNEERIRAVYESRDPRLEANVITPYSTFRGYAAGDVNVVTSRWPYTTIQTSPIHDLGTDTAGEFYYLHRKFVFEGDEITNGGRHYGPTDFPIIRYADVLLMWAEALTESTQSVNADAIALVNMVRQRAGVALLNSSSETTVRDYQDLINRIRDERRKELIGEGINYFDELRWKTLKESSYYEGSGKKSIWGDMREKFAWPGDHAYQWAIPLSEIQRNPNLEQNPGWGN